MSDNTTSGEKSINSSNVPRLSIRIPRNFHASMKESNTTRKGLRENIGPLSPRTTTVSHPSSTSKEVPRAALLFSENEVPTTSDFNEISADLIGGGGISPPESVKDHHDLVADSIQGLKALAASAAAASLPEEQQNSDRGSSPPDFSRGIEINEDEVLGKLFNSMSEDCSLPATLNVYCKNEFREQARVYLDGMISKANDLVHSKGISMNLNCIFPLFVKRLSIQESSRNGIQDLTVLLMNERFMSAAATITVLLPRLVSILVPMNEVIYALNADCFDVLLTVEPVLRALPELLQLPNTLKRLKELQDVILEEDVWKVNANDGTSTIYKLLESEYTESPIIRDIASSTVLHTLSGVRSCHKALEMLTGFSVVGSRVSRLELFFRKYLRLAAQRLQFATTRLGLKEQVTQLSWEFFFELIQREGGPLCSMFKNRHLNQILLAVIYCSIRLLGQERTFQQICQALPTLTNQNTWLSSIYKDQGRSCDFFTFYNEIFLPPLKGRIETFLEKLGEASNDDNWIVNELFTRSPFPSNQLHRIGNNSTLKLVNPRRERFKGPMTKYQWISPYSSTNTATKTEEQHTDDLQQVHILPQTPTNTSQLLNILPSTDLKREYVLDPDDDIGCGGEEKEEKDSFRADRVKKISRRLDFNE